MVHKNLFSAVLGVIIFAEAIYLTYSYVQFRKIESFNCVANLVQHYSDEYYNVSLNYMIRGKFGLLHITGRSNANPKKIFNRKISFKLQRNGDLYYMVSEKNIKLPDDNFNDDELALYEPRFIITPGQDIYMRIIKQRSSSFVFMVDSIPTYVCNTYSGGN